jgi:hypothetical protein
MAVEIGSHYSLLDDLDVRQDDLLEQIDGLNRRIELLLTQYTSTLTARVPFPVEDEPAEP